jgi:hypothetical protein
LLAAHARSLTVFSMKEQLALSRAHYNFGGSQLDCESGGMTGWILD